jgi:hypothetical protein
VVLLKLTEGKAKMKLFKITDDYVDCHVVALEKDQAVSMSDVEDFFQDSEGVVVAEELADDAEVNIVFTEEGLAIKHTAKEWCAIYNQKAQMIACSEV